MSAFKGIRFDWEFGNPKRTIQDGVLHLGGSVILYNQGDLDRMFGVVRPCTVRVAGDPSAGGLVYVDHWGPDPSGPLSMTYLPGDTDEPNPVTYKAILTSLSRNEALPRGVHKGEVDFIILVDLLTNVPGTLGSPRTGQSSVQIGVIQIDPITNEPVIPPDPNAPQGQRIDSVMGSNTGDTGALSLWDGAGGNFEPPDQWEQDYFDHGDWPNSVQASNSSSVGASTAVWSSSEPEGDGEEVLFAQTFNVSLDDGEEIAGAILYLQFYEHLTGGWINGDTLFGDLGVPQPMPVSPESLRPNEQNLIAISCVSGSGRGFVSYRLDVYIQRAGTTTAIVEGDGVMPDEEL